ncbi:heavy-metal-associated domain-containing protein [Altererythrobacter arenosus]|uniref:Heavy-metal-associated domain-containing protein n=1 Tax=Altererythrobacter arenosus TaxID=3032592 RepID=A0ABY8FN97_9SPHN|nr:heavy-metal-associated domain-containing protein [Altererythrobacter sp. CAU 1644]WFL76499.1 heavy-metal-associated domain-containing protein [Altererythrobacter sp. CAU 1644]
MALTFSPSSPLPTTRRIAAARLLWALGVLALLAAAIAVWAQVEGERGIAPVASSSDIDVGGIEVDVRGDTAEEAREKGWREAQRLAWEKIGGPKISDSQLEGLVSAVVIERERIGPRRYIATLGVIFDRARAGGYLGGAAQGQRSAPMLLLPVTVSAGTTTMYEVRNPWQRAWAEFNPGTSLIDYVRPSGAGGDSLLLTYGQTGRRSRTWWRAVLDQFGAADVLIPLAELRYRWPGGPVEGTFTARYGPDSRYLDGFTLTADNPAELPAMLGQAVRRFDDIFEQALADGKLRPDPTLREGGGGDIDPALQRLIEIGRAIQRREAAELAGEGDVPVATPTAAPTQAAVVSSYVVQFASPDAASIDATLGAVRSTPGVRGAATTSLAIGGTSVMTVSFGGSLDQLAAALRQRGFNVTQGSNALAISR